MNAKDLSGTAIVVASGQEQTRDVVSGILGKAGFRVLEASTGDAVLRHFRESSFAAGLAVIDTPLSGMNASEFLRCLREIAPDVRVLLLSEDHRGETERYTRPYHLVLKKPFRRSQLLGNVLELQSREIVLTA
jgi:DNA-binding response OmpR family regulator